MLVWQVALVWMAGCEGDKAAAPLPEGPPGLSTSVESLSAPSATVELATQAIRLHGVGIGMLVAGADLDGDGLQDLVTASFEAVWSVTSPLTSGSINAVGLPLPDPPLLTDVLGLGDTDGDGTSEVVLAIEYMGPVSRAMDPWAAVVLSGSDPSQVASWVYDPRLEGMLGSHSYHVAAPGDVDGDGLADLAISDAYGLSLFRGPLAEVVEVGSDEDGRLLSEQGRLGESLVAGDFDLDGIADLAVHGGWGWDVLVVDGNLQGSVVAETAAFASFSGAEEELMHAVSSGDLDGDGAADLLLDLMNEARAPVAWGPLQGAQPVAALTDGLSERGMLPVGDLDGDGTDDLAKIVSPDERSRVVHLWYGPLAGLSQGEADAFLVLEDVADERFPEFEDLAGLGDVNGDGFDDLAVGNPFGAGGTTYVLLGGER